MAKDLCGEGRNADCHVECRTACEGGPCVLDRSPDEAQAAQTACAKTYNEKGWGEQVGSFCPFCGEAGACQC